MRYLEFRMPGDDPAPHAVSVVRVTFEPGHDVISVWNRGGNAGQLVVQKGDWAEYVTRFGFVPSEPTREGDTRALELGLRLLESYERAKPRITAARLEAAVFTNRCVECGVRVPRGLWRCEEHL